MSKASDLIHCGFSQPGNARHHWLSNIRELPSDACVQSFLQSRLKLSMFLQ